MSLFTDEELENAKNTNQSAIADDTESYGKRMNVTIVLHTFKEEQRERVQRFADEIANQIRDAETHAESSIRIGWYIPSGTVPLEPPEEIFGGLKIICGPGCVNRNSVIIYHNSLEKPKEVSKSKLDPDFLWDLAGDYDTDYLDAWVDAAERWPNDINKLD